MVSTETAGPGTTPGYCQIDDGGYQIRNVRNGRVIHGASVDLNLILDAWLAAHADGIACVVTTDTGAVTSSPNPLVRSLKPELAKGLEFDLVVMINPDSFGSGIEGAADRYVAMTRASRQLIILTTG